MGGVCHGERFQAAEGAQAHSARQARALWRMRVLTGPVFEGKAVLAGSGLPDGMAVTAFAEHPCEKVHLSPRLHAELEVALDETDREEGISSEEPFEQPWKYR